MIDVTAVISKVGKTGRYRLLWMQAPEIASTTHPGQFVQVTVPGAYLRRPFSVWRTTKTDVAIAFDAVGHGTQALSELREGATVKILGPLGVPFKACEGPAALLGGGYGAAALSMLAEALRARGNVVHAVLGARTGERIFNDDTFDNTCQSVRVMTEDGSAGMKGIVTDPLKNLVEVQGVRTVYACGPMSMLKAIAGAAKELGIDSYVATEEFMACGIGVCFTCVVPLQREGYRAHARSCIEGPVFDGSEVAWA